jgi:excisionase family DNA binding protein
MKLLLTKAEAAEALGTGVDRIRALVEAGEVGFVEIGGDERIPADELDRWVRSRTKHKCPSGDAAIPLPTPGGSGSASTGAATSSRAGRRAKEPPRPWNESFEPPSRPATAAVVDLIQSGPRLPDTGRSTDDS